MRTNKQQTFGVKAMELSIETMARNVFKTYLNADSVSIVEGIIWYKEANLLAEKLAEEFGMTTEQTSLIIAALSPRTDWETNKKNAYEFINRIYVYKTTFPGMMRSCTDKCVLIYYNSDLKTSDDRTSYPTFLWETNPLNKASVLGSKSYKTKAFARTIFNPTMPESSVVIDTHAINISNGYWQATGSFHSKVFRNWDMYNYYSNAYLMAANWVEQPVHVVQAVTWCAWRRTLSNYRAKALAKKRGM